MPTKKPVKKKKKAPARASKILSKIGPKKGTGRAIRKSIVTAGDVQTRTRKTTASGKKTYGIKPGSTKYTRIRTKKK